MSRNYTPAYNPGGDLFSEDESFSQSYEAYEKRRADILKEREDDKQSRARSKSTGVRSQVSDAERDRILEKLRKYGVKHSVTSERSKSGMVNSEGVDLSRVKGARFIDVDLDNSRRTEKDADEINDALEGAVSVNGGSAVPAAEVVEGSVHQDSGVAKEDSSDCSCMDKCDCACCSGKGVQGEEGVDVIDDEATDGPIDAAKSGVADVPVDGVVPSGVDLHCDCGEDCKCDHGKHALPSQVDEETEEGSSSEHIPLFGGAEDVDASGEHGSSLVGEQSPSCDCGKVCDCGSNKHGAGGTLCDCSEKCRCADCHCVGHGAKEDVVQSSSGMNNTGLHGDGSLGCDCGKGCKCEKCDCAECHCANHGKHREDSVPAEDYEPVGHNENRHVASGTDVDDDGKCSCCDRCDLPDCKHDAKGASEISEERVDIVTAPEEEADFDDIENNARDAVNTNEVALEGGLEHRQTVAEGNGSHSEDEMLKLGASDVSDEEFGKDADWTDEDYTPLADIGSVDNGAERDDGSVGMGDVGNIYGSGDELDDALSEDRSEDSRGATGADNGQRSSGIGMIDNFGGDSHSKGTAEYGIEWGFNAGELGRDEESGEDSVDRKESQEDVFVEDPDDAGSERDGKALFEDDEEEDYSWDDDFSDYDGVIDFSDIVEGPEAIFSDEFEEEEGGGDTSMSSEGYGVDLDEDAQHEVGDKRDQVSAADIRGYKGLADDEENQEEGYYELPLTFNGRSPFLDFDR